MKEKEFYKIKEKLINEKNKNNRQISIFDERKRMANINQMEHKLQITLGVSMVSYMLLLFGTKLIDLSKIVSVLPIYSIPIIHIGCSLCGGIMGLKLFENKYKTKEKFSKFSNSKTNAKKIEEELSYAIELNKLDSRNDVIDKTIDCFDTCQKIFKFYNLSPKSISNNEVELEKRIKQLNNKLKQEYDELDKLIEQKVLNENFKSLKCDLTNIGSMLTFVIGGGIISTSLIGFSLMAVKDLAFNIPILMPFILGSVISSSYLIKSNSDRKKAFDSLNLKLEKNTSFKNIKNSCFENLDLEDKIESKINDIAIVEVQLEELKIELNNFKLSNQEKTNEKSFENYPLLTEEEVKIYMQDSNALLLETLEALDDEQGPKLIKKL